MCCSLFFPINLLGRSVLNCRFIKSNTCSFCFSRRGALLVAVIGARPFSADFSNCAVVPKRVSQYHIPEPLNELRQLMIGTCTHARNIFYLCFLSSEYVKPKGPSSLASRNATFTVTILQTIFQGRTAHKLDHSNRLIHSRRSRILIY